MQVLDRVGFEHGNDTHLLPSSYSECRGPLTKNDKEMSWGGGRVIELFQIGTSEWDAKIRGMVAALVMAIGANAAGRPLRPGKA
jgi:hypothetical protein